MILDFWLATEVMWKGVVIVIDMTGFTFAHLAKVKLFVIQKFMYYVQVRIIFTMNGFNGTKQIFSAPN